MLFSPGCNCCDLSPCTITAGLCGSTPYPSPSVTITVYDADNNQVATNTVTPTATDTITGGGTVNGAAQAIQLFRTWIGGGKLIFRPQKYGTYKVVVNAVEDQYYFKGFDGYYNGYAIHENGGVFLSGQASDGLPFVTYDTPKTYSIDIKPETKINGVWSFNYGLPYKDFYAILIVTPIKNYGYYKNRNGGYDLQIGYLPYQFPISYPVVNFSPGTPYSLSGSITNGSMIMKAFALRLPADTTTSNLVSATVGSNQCVRHNYDDDPNAAYAFSGTIGGGYTLCATTTTYCSAPGYGKQNYCPDYDVTYSFGQPSRPLKCTYINIVCTQYDLTSYYNSGITLQTINPCNVAVPINFAASYAGFLDCETGYYGPIPPQDNSNSYNPYGY